MTELARLLPRLLGAGGRLPRPGGRGAWRAGDWAGEGDTGVTRPSLERHVFTGPHRDTRPAPSRSWDTRAVTRGDTGQLLTWGVEWQSCAPPPPSLDTLLACRAPLPPRCSDLLRLVGVAWVPGAGVVGVAELKVDMLEPGLGSRWLHDAMLSLPGHLGLLLS